MYERFKYNIAFTASVLYRSLRECIENERHRLKSCRVERFMGKSFGLIDLSVLAAARYGITGDCRHFLQPLPDSMAP